MTEHSKQAKTKKNSLDAIETGEFSPLVVSPVLETRKSSVNRDSSNKRIPVYRYSDNPRRTGLSDEEVRRWFARDPKTELKAHLCRIIRKLVSLGVLKVDDPLPPVKHLAELLEIYPSVVGYAYAELTKEGILRGVRGLGIFVADPDPARRWLADDSFSDAITFCRQIGLDEGEIERSFRSQVLAAFSRRKSESQN